MERNERNVAMTLRILYGVVPIVAGLDKFTNLLVDWTKYLPTQVASLLPVTPHAFMAAVGVIEIAAGLIVLSRWTKIGAFVVMAWLVAIAVNLLVAGYYDVAVRDLAMAVGAWSLSQLWIPAEERSGARRTVPA